jgi:predicted DNA-binding protein
LTEYQTVIYFCLSFCRAFNKLLREIDEETIEDMFDLLIVANLTDEEQDKAPKKIFIDQTDL